MGCPSLWELDLKNTVCGSFSAFSFSFQAAWQVGKAAERSSPSSQHRQSMLSAWARRGFAAASAAAPKRVAVVLSGCGVYDGTEITEGVSAMIHLTGHGATPSCFAPNKEQMHVVNHLDGTEMNEARNVLVESARIGRGSVAPLDALNASEFDALVIPGGFGAAKNLSTFAVDGPEMSVDEDVSRVVSDFHAAGKPIGLCCIAPTLAAKLIPGCEVTVGMSSGSEDVWPHQGAAGGCEAMGATHIDTDISSAGHVDERNKLVTTCAYMKNASAAEVHESVGHMVSGVLGMA